MVGNAILNNKFKTIAFLILNNFHSTIASRGGGGWGEENIRDGVVFLRNETSDESLFVLKNIRCVRFASGIG